MNVQNLVRASAQIVRITELSVGDAVKIVQENYSGAELKYGVVTDLMNDGEKSYIQLVMLAVGYGEVKRELKLISQKESESMVLFPSSREEIKTAFEENMESFERGIEKSREELEKKIEGLKLAKSIINGTSEIALTTPKFEVLESFEKQKTETKELADIVF